MPTNTKQSSLGRPPKFQEPSSSITITLPHRILRELEEIDSDRARGIVRCVDAVMAMGRESKQGVEMIVLPDSRGILVIGRCQSLQSIPWLQLVEITPSRYLVTVPVGTTVEALEVAIMDLLETLTDAQRDDKEMLLEFRRQLSQYRRLDAVHSREIFILNL